MSSVHSSYKFVIALNKVLEPGVALNAAAHMSLGLCARATPEQRENMHFLTFVDANENEHPSISALSLIVLRGTNGEVRKLVQAAKEQGILYVDFLETMTGGTYKEQLERTRNASADMVTYYGVALFGPKEVIDPLTKKLSLWK
jgi:hypothetical protein